MRCTPLKLVRIQAGLRQVELELRTGIRRARLSEIENGWVEAKPEELSRLARALSVPVETLTGAASTAL